MKGQFLCAAGAKRRRPGTLLVSTFPFGRLKMKLCVLLFVRRVARLVPAAISVCLCLADATAVHAQGLPGVPAGTVLNEVMMDAQGTEALLYGALLGASPSSPQSLSGTTTTDPSQGSFQFSLNPGSTYLGQSLSDSVQGHFNPGSNNYSWTGGGAIVGGLWTVQGTVTPSETSSMGPAWNLSMSAQLAINGNSYLLSGVETLTGTGSAPSPAVGSGTATLSDLSNPGLGVMTLNTTGAANGPEFDTSLSGSFLRPAFDIFFILDSDTAPFAGGPGTYNTTIASASAPEPSAFVTALLGGLGVFGYARRKRASLRHS
jgi:hypothetical protein